MTRFFTYSVALSAFALVPAGVSAATTAAVEGSAMKVIEINPEANTGLNKIFVVNNSAGCTLNFKVADPATAKVSKYSNLGAAYAEEVRDPARGDGTVSVTLPAEDMGYMVEDSGTNYFCWVVNYANHQLSINSVTAPQEEQDCSYSILNIDGNASAITFYTINGQGRTLSRDITVTYTTEEFDTDSNSFFETAVEKTFESLGSTVSLSPPAYCVTYFTVEGDRFLETWGMGIKVETGMVNPVAIDSRTEAVQEETDSEEGSNVMGGDSNGLGGSAPAYISFYAYTTGGVLHNEWQMSRNPEFENPEYRFYQKDLDYTFDEEGTYYLRYIGSNADGTCETVGDTYTVSIGASALECPNAFSPNGDGVNDIWKVSYRSIIDFHCEIFNRNGQRLYGYDDPSGGWDGTWNGKTVKPGVYYYVITATGADGQKYKKSGDINIINSVNYGTSTAPIPEE